MSIDECKQIILDNFRSMKLEKDYAQLQLLLYQLTDLISQHEKRIDLQNEIIDKQYRVVKQMGDKGLISDFDYVKWHQKRIDEVSSWKRELDMLVEYKYHIGNILKQIEDGTAQQSLIEQENEWFD